MNILSISLCFRTAAPQKVLLIGSGFSGALREIIKYTPKQIFYTELDPSIIGLARAYIPAFRQILDGGRVLVIKEDPRRSLKRLPKDLDVIIINLPNPSTALINRYFTDDFFKEARGHLPRRGIRRWPPTPEQRSRHGIYNGAHDGAFRTLHRWACL